MNRLLIIPRIQIHAANALSSPYSIGFPAMTAWLGGVHALQRKLNADVFENLRFKRAAVACHRIDLQTYKGLGDYEHSIVGTGNPLDKTGERPSFIEEARCHLNVTVVIEYQGTGKDSNEALLAAVARHLHSMKLAGGDILGFKEPYVLKIDGDNELSKLTRRLMPAYVLRERRDLMTEAMQTGQDAIDAMLDYLTVKNRSSIDATGQVEWTATRKTPGWIVPIASGFHGISELGQAENTRDPETPHCFAESLLTLGEFVMPYRIQRLGDLFWHSHYDAENRLYLIQQHSHSV